MNDRYYTYMWIDPKTNIIRYIGKGKDYRAFKHLVPSKRDKIGNLLKKRKKEGYDLEPIIHYEVDEQTALKMEMFWIAFYGRENIGTGTLYNLTDGGEGSSGCIFTEERKQNISKATKGRKPWNKGTAKPKEQVRGTPESKERMRQAQLGKKHSKEVNAKKGKLWTE